MNARTRIVRLSDGVEFVTPLLVPSFSSRAWGPLSFDGGRPQPSSVWQSKTLLGTIEESLLVSAYDIRHDLLDATDQFAMGFAGSAYSKPELLILDSGWYEKDAAGGGQIWSELEIPLPWEKSDYESVIDSLDKSVKALVVSWDYRGSYESQIEAAQEFFGRRRRFPSTLLLKPPGGAAFHHFRRLSSASASDLRAFDVIGVTEKDLGRSLNQRLKELFQLRNELDAAAVDAPIHVFGGLDPLFTPLYFAAGAEIFDGLGWIRYAYRDGRALHIESAAILDGEADDSLEVVRARTAIHNLSVLRDLAGELQVLAESGDWSKVRQGDEYFKRVFERVVAGSGGRRGR